MNLRSALQNSGIRWDSRFATSRNPERRSSSGAYRRAEVILVPLAEWRRLKQLESDLDEPDPFDFDDE